MTNEQLLRIGDSTVCPAAVMIKNDHILLGLRNYTPDKWKEISVWTTPGGRCDEGETIEQALRREVSEEVGISEFSIHEHISDIPGAKEGDIVPIFYCTTTQEPTLMEPEKFSQWKWVPIEEYMQGAPYSTMNPGAHALIAGYLKNKHVGG